MSDGGTCVPDDPAEQRSAGIRHDWDLSATEARRLQSRLAAGIRIEPLAGVPSLIAGVDCGLERDGRIRAVVTLLRYPSLETARIAVARTPCRFPYVPGLLSFREMPAVLAALEMLPTMPDLLLCDGQGIAHPRRLGIASHLGLWLDRPSIGVGKSRLIGSFREPGMERGDWTPLLEGRERIGSVVRTRSRVRPVFVSPGHRIDHDSAVDWVLRTVTRYRLPDPIRLADKATRSSEHRQK